MSSFFESYKSQFHNKDEIVTIDKTCSELVKNIQIYSERSQQVDGLLFGNVQSGKTRQMLGALSLLADNNYPFFVVLTTDNIDLHIQTLKRVKAALNLFCVIGEHDDVEFLQSKLQKPTIVVLKKNGRILAKWRSLISQSQYCTARPLIVFDDEADAASLNTQINNNSISTINRHLIAIKKLSSFCAYIQTTATPQAILLQSHFSGWRPDFIVFFEPGSGYLGGDFFFSSPSPYCIKFTEENELDSVRDDSTYIPEGLRKSLLSFLVVCAHKKSKGKTSCNFLIHPGVKKEDHTVFANRICEHLNLLLSAIDEQSVIDELEMVWTDLRTTQPDLYNFEDTVSVIKELLVSQTVRPLIINSASPYNIDVSDGYNIIIGGNCLGRGLTLPHLQTVYYCRRARVPQADTSWQHSRMFGYDRERGLMRVFVPYSLYKLFSTLNQSNNILINQIRQGKIDGIQLILSQGIRPTRRNVLNTNELFILTGGVNYFPLHPVQDNTDAIDALTSDYRDIVPFHKVATNEIKKILSTFLPPPEEDWDLSKHLNCVNALETERPTVPCILILRRNRDISRETGTLLSPNDRELGESFHDAIVLTIYRVNGTKDKGWNGNPFWIPNIKFPDNTCYYDTKKY